MNSHNPEESTYLVAPIPLEDIWLPIPPDMMEIIPDWLTQMGFPDSPPLGCCVADGGEYKGNLMVRFEAEGSQHFLCWNPKTDHLVVFAEDRE